MRKKSHLAIVLVLLYLVFFLYRVAFWDDFLFSNLLQILLNALFDISIVFLLGIAVDKILLGNAMKDRKTLTRIALCISLVPAYYLCVKLLKLMHYFAYTITVGFSKEFRVIFNLESYQVFDTYIVVAFGSVVLLAFKFYEKWNIERAWKEQAEKERAVAELGFLKAQINPHFIFNTLNNIHFLIDKTNEQARKVIHDFCELLRYQLYETGNEKVSIKKEIMYLEHYILLQKIRKENGFAVTFEVTELPDFQIAPLLLIVPVENAFKYAGSSSGAYIRISMYCQSGNFFVFKVVNSISKEIPKKDKSESGLGLANLKKRLELFYDHKATLEINHQNDHYEVFITINLKKDEDY